MQLSFTHKEHFFHSLAQMIRSGIPAPKAIEQLRLGRDRIGRAARRVSARLEAGFAEAFRTNGFSTLDVEILAAGEQSGRLEEASVRLSEYYATLAKARRAMIAKSIYPVFVIHVGALLLSIPRAILANEGNVYLMSVVGILLPIYLLVGVIGVSIWGLRRLARSSVIVDLLIRLIPGLGGLFRTAALARFCLVLSLGIRSADGVLASLRRAGRASLSANIETASSTAVTAIRRGTAFTAALAASRAFPDDLERSFRVAEVSGRLDEEMGRAAEMFRIRFFSLVDAMAEWIPRLLYLAVVFSVAYQIYQLALTVGRAVSDALEI